MKKYFLYFALVSLVGFATLTEAAYAAEDEVPTSIKSKTMTYDANSQRIVFRDDVYVVRGDFELWADVITVYIDEKAGAAKKTEGGEEPAIDAGQIEKLVAEGNVSMKQQTKSGECRKATYNVGSGVLVMEGDPILRDEGNSIRGHEIRFYVHENKSEVIGAPDKPVNAVFSAPKRTSK